MWEELEADRELTDIGVFPLKEKADIGVFLRYLGQESCLLHRHIICAIGFLSVAFEETLISVQAGELGTGSISIETKIVNVSS